MTGASSGIGRAYANRLARDGYHLVLTARRADRLEALARELRGRCRVRVEVTVADLSTEEGVAAGEARLSSGPPVEMLVNSAGFGTRGLFADIAPDRTADMVRLHVLAPVRLARAALPAMIAGRNGAIINVCSLGAFFTAARYVTYSATKAYLLSFSESLQAETAAHNIRVQALCPGLTRTEFFDSPEYSDFNYSNVPDWAWMTADAVAAESLAALESGSTVCVPGLHNRIFMRVMKAPLLGALFGRAIDWVSRGREVY